MSAFLLIHGGSHEAWCWDGAMRELSRLGHEADALHLPEEGNKATPRTKTTFM
ncbi:hypothetical protein YTPLAS18_10110 [Nitrospira sp.]|nr:hypothetical protein YTPLAS18_10110 [Nitrospira sp.]